MKPCADKREAIAMLAAGTLAPAEAAALRSHMQECAGCNVYSAQLGAICAQLGEPAAGAATAEPPPGFHARLKERIQSEGHSSSRPSLFEVLRLLFTVPRIVSATALATLVLGFAFWMRSDKGSVDQRALHAVQESTTNGTSNEADLSSASTLMAYQAAFNRSLEDFDALVTQNAARASTADGMTLMRSGTASF
jgi:anti-sigma factor RsiW